MSQSDCAIVSYVTTMDFHLSRMSVMILLQQIQHVIARANPNLSNHAHIITIPIMVIIRFMSIVGGHQRENSGVPHLANE